MPHDIGNNPFYSKYVSFIDLIPVAKRVNLVAIGNWVQSHSTSLSDSLKSPCTESETLNRY